MNSPIITLLTDFGLEDAYVAQMKGQILSICPSARLVDITHAIPPQDVAYAALVLAQAVPYFPDGTVHVAVVDPGVGTDRRIIAVELMTRTEPGDKPARQRCVLPDNGLIGRLASRSEIVTVHEVRESRFWRSRISSTFHGRDIMGPVGAHWAAGTDCAAFGPRIETLPASGVWPEPTVEGPRTSGEIIAVDHFGNVITNLPAKALDTFDRQPVEIVVDGRRVVLQPVQTYGQQPVGTAVILAGSHELVEMAIVGGSAAERLDLRRGQRVTFARG